MPFIKNIDSRTFQSQADARRIFIGRANELAFFVHNILRPEDPTYNIISVSGSAGVGKSALLARFIDTARSSDFKDYCLTAIVDGRQITPAGIMEKFANQLREIGYPLDGFEKGLFHYKEALRKLQVEKESGRDALVRETVDWTGTAVENVPIVGSLLQEGAKAATEYFLRERRNYQLLKDAERLDDPIGDLTKAFVEELNRLTETQLIFGPSRVKRRRRVLLFFDAFEQLASEASPWLLDHFLEADVSTNVVLVVAGRAPIERSTPDDPIRWLPYLDNNTIYLISLNSFTEDETRTYLAERGITESSSIVTIWQLSRGLPLYLGLLTSNPQGKVDPTADVVANFLRWIPEQEQVKRRLALDAALLSRPFNQDDLMAFSYLPEQDRSSLYRWLIRQPFVRSSPHEGRYSYHDLAQELFCRHLYQISPLQCQSTRRILAEYYQWQLENELVREEEKVYDSAEWLELVRALVYQLLLLPDEASHINAIAQVLKAYIQVKRPEEISRVLRELSQQQHYNQATPSARQTAQQLLLYVESTSSREFVTVASNLLDKVAREPSFPSELLAAIYSNRGLAYTELKEYRRAINDFSYATESGISNASVYYNRGLAYAELKEYQQAIADFNRAIELDSTNASAYYKRGLAYTELKEYQQAINDFSRATKLDPTKVAGKPTLLRPLRVYLCHSSNDKTLVRALHQRLRTDGLDSWLDEENLLPGQYWQQEIRKAIKAADVFIVCLSRGSINKSGFLQKEMKYALGMTEEKPEDATFLILLKLEDCDTPERLRRLHHINLFQEGGYERLLRMLLARTETILTSGTEAMES